MASPSAAPCSTTTAAPASIFQFTHSPSLACSRYCTLPLAPGIVSTFHTALPSLPPHRHITPSQRLHLHQRIEHSPTPPCPFPTAMHASFTPSAPLPMRHKRRLAHHHARPHKRVRACAPGAAVSRALRAFRPAAFTPYPSSNTHVQTVVANFFPPAAPVSYCRVRLRSADGQAVLLVDVANGRGLAHAERQPFVGRDGVVTLPEHPLRSRSDWEKSPPVVVVLHGLESNSSAIVTRRIVTSVGEHGFKVAVLNYRSCADGDDIPTTLRLYHAGFTEDLQTLLQGLRESALAVHREPPDVYLCGFSLGANVMCQFLGRFGARASAEFNVVAAAAACVPFDPVSCQRKLDFGWRGFVYSKRLVHTMQDKFFKAKEAGVDVGSVVAEKIKRADRVGLIDDAFIVPVFGFKDRMDYYSKVDSRKVLKHITVPTLVINARDDPFFDHEDGQSLPTRDQLGEAPILMHVTEHGGHCGFLDRQGFHQKAPCYFQREFARFFVHMREAHQQDAADAHHDQNGSESPSEEAAAEVSEDASTV